MFVLRRGTFGRKIYAVGRSPEVARRVAISTTNVRVSAYVMCGVLAAFAGIILSAYVGYVDPTIGGNYNLESIAAAVLGGVAFTGGEGGALGALAGALFLLALLNVVTLSSLNPYTQLIVQGVVHARRRFRVPAPEEGGPRLEKGGVKHDWSPIESRGRSAAGRALDCGGSGRRARSAVAAGVSSGAAHGDSRPIAFISQGTSNSWAAQLDAVAKKTADRQTA